ncbi:sulfite oxidase [Planctomyces sp. SH-PL62]|uniref:sulfite oxidase n=1 Tax=Planctomyces sp. SH-PL62 TaxID=1636152 RepID=UPI00078C448A|nr:sulfite oxidase [Planctomyces sp. SH-PL62]AMV38213.1 TMAO/DMSO reductase [Planctomyces sp. SH-PL62]
MASDVENPLAREGGGVPAAGLGPDRRGFLASLWGGMLGVGGLAGGLDRGGLGVARGDEGAVAADRRMIVRTERPLNLESPSAALDSFLTPNEGFFVRSHHGAPAVGLRTWEVVVEGLVDRPLKLSLADLEAMDATTIPAVLQCAGNGRGLFRPRMPGLTWERGAVGHAEWAGVRLAALLERAGVKPEAAHVHFIGGDVPPTTKAPPFTRSIPLARALADDSLIALKMNGEPLPVLHGGPARLVVPGWAANNWSKWVRRIVVSAEEAQTFYMKTGYRIPREPVPPGVNPDPASLVPVEWMNVKSLITSPDPDASLPLGPREVRGVAWTGEGHVVKVEVSTVQDPTWREAELLDEPRQGSWRRFKLAWTPPAAGSYTLQARATDSRGEIQPEVSPWNKSGYLWNGYDRIPCVVS